MFQIVKDFPLPAYELDKAVSQFCQESDDPTHDAPVDKRGLYTQTLDNIAQILVYKPEGRYFWLDHDEKKVLAYALTHVSRDVDNQYCYYMTQAWVHPSMRGTSAVKEMYQKLRQHAKDLLCKHIIVVSSRNDKAYLRFLGKGWKPYVTLLKEDI